MTQQHTMGPWKINKVGPATCYIIHSGETDIAMTYSSTPVTEQEENAKLIAAAPDLLAALEQLVELIPMKRYPIPLLKAKIAIAKARGQS